MSTETEKKSVGLPKSEYDVVMARIEMARAQHDAVVQGWIAKSARANEPRKTQAELEAEDAALFRPQPPRLGLGCPIPPQFLKNDGESSTKDLRAKFFPSKTLKASKARNAEEKAASAKRGLKDESSDEEGGRSSLGRAKKLKTKPHHESVKNELQDIKCEPAAIKEGIDVSESEHVTETLKTGICPGNTSLESSLPKSLVVQEVSGETNCSDDLKLHEERKKKPKIHKIEDSTLMEVEQDDLGDTTLADKPEDVNVLDLSEVDRISSKLDGVEVGAIVEDEAEILRRKKAKKREKLARKKERKEKRRSERAAGSIS
jgi:hypothetical protein